MESIVLLCRGERALGRGPIKRAFVDNCYRALHSVALCSAFGTRVDHLGPKHLAFSTSSEKCRRIQATESSHANRFIFSFPSVGSFLYISIKIGSERPFFLSDTRKYYFQPNITPLKFASDCQAEISLTM